MMHQRGRVCVCMRVNSYVWHIIHRTFWATRHHRGSLLLGLPGVRAASGKVEPQRSYCNTRSLRSLGSLNARRTHGAGAQDALVLADLTLREDARVVTDGLHEANGIL